MREVEELEKHFTFTMSVEDGEKLARLIDDYLRARDALTGYVTCSRRL